MDLTRVKGGMIQNGLSSGEMGRLLTFHDSNIELFPIEQEQRKNNNNNSSSSEFQIYKGDVPDMFNAKPLPTTMAAW